MIDEQAAAASGVVTVGANVELEREDGEMMTVEISSVGGVSPESPVGRAVIGKRRRRRGHGRGAARGVEGADRFHPQVGVGFAAVSAVPVSGLDELQAYADAVAGCTRCRLAQGRTQVVFGMGDPHADLMFVGEAPGFHEDKQGLPFVGQAGKLLEKLLAQIGLTRAEVYIANVLKCLSYLALVQLGDGSWERIGRLVSSRYQGTVMSLDDDGCLVPRAVNGWHATPVADRRVFKLTYKSAKRAGASKVGIQLTGDHEVMTERGWVATQDLRAGDRIATGQGLSALAKDVVCGTLLGDGSISRGKGALQFGHSAKQLEYALFKAELLAELKPVSSELEVAAVAGGTPAYSVVQVRTHAHEPCACLLPTSMNQIRHVPAWIADALNPRMLAMWFMDGGYTRIRPTARPVGRDRDMRFRRRRHCESPPRFPAVGAPCEGTSWANLLRCSNDEATVRAHRPLRSFVDALQAPPRGRRNGPIRSVSARTRRS